jgi:hypothetical protein
MGFYYEQKPGPNDDRDKGPGCIDVIVITRVVFGILLWPILAMAAVILDIAVAFYVFTIHPALALIPLAITMFAVYLLARWDQNRERPEGFDDLPPPPLL